ncbi:nuclear transport factor 2 family protein [Hymenobacter cellulosivorans]|uniref:Nuclear transport factor 2 family protein n=1 Tax=Hymenobacter cellulosivorans TaxID=2932249 RepID=A0ABY4F6L4_9BACT|nr:nuclear transport factor 2 family protein [Hymenobacter cellulosivorans]UOQ51856.1 nuclear transport factor 2 family protein [Hymenobacter cellulosivorans]
MKKLLLASCFLALAPAAFAQTSPAETAAVKKTITTFFDGMRKGDSAMVRSTLAPGVVLHTIMSRNGAVQTGTEKAAEFLKLVGTPHKEVYDERISFEQVLIDANLASVWTPYQFYVGPKFSHCGYNSFQLVKFTEGWKIVHIIDTRRKEGCK